MRGSCSPLNMSMIRVPPIRPRQDTRPAGPADTVPIRVAPALTAWRRGENIFLAEPGRPETQIGAGKDVALALSGGRPYAIWSNGGRIESWSAGKVDVLSSAGSFPFLSSLASGGVLAVWEEGDAIQIRRLP